MTKESVLGDNSIHSTGGPFVSSLMMEYVQHTMLYLADAIQFCAAILIGLAAAQAAFRSLVVFFRRDAPESATEEIRLRLGRWLVLALEFQVAADILRTAVAPTWNEIGQLAAVIVLRTALNFFLQKEFEKSAPKKSSEIPVVPEHQKGT